MIINRLVILSCIFLLAGPATAMRCGNKLISEGSPQSKVLKFCGEPESTQVRSILRAGFPRYRSKTGVGGTRATAPRGELLFADRAYVEIVVEEWIYNFGPRRLMRLVRFENGLVADVTELSYGYH